MQGFADLLRHRQAKPDQHGGLFQFLLKPEHGAGGRAHGIKSPQCCFPQNIRGAVRKQAQLLDLAAQVQQHSTDHTFRFDASRAYFALVNKRTRELREERIQGYQRLGYFLDRRLSPAMKTMEAVRGRLETLSDHIDRAASLIRTRVDLSLQRKSSHLLHSMDRRSAQQLRLQQTVEGLSLVAISYYSLGIVMYLARAAVDFGIPLNPTIVTGLAAPLIIGCVYWVIHRISKQMNKYFDT